MKSQRDVCCLRRRNRSSTCPWLSRLLPGKLVVDDRCGKPFPPWRTVYYVFDPPSQNPNSTFYLPAPSSEIQKIVTCSCLLDERKEQQEQRLRLPQCNSIVASFLKKIKLENFPRAAAIKGCPIVSHCCLCNKHFQPIVAPAAAGIELWNISLCIVQAPIVGQGQCAQNARSDKRKKYKEVFTCAVFLINLIPNDAAAFNNFLLFSLMHWNYGIGC